MNYKLMLKFQWGIRSEYKNDDDGAVISESSKIGDEMMSQSTRVKRSAVNQSVLDKEHKRTKERTIGYIIEKVS